jgi:hypothetical protein
VVPGGGAAVAPCSSEEEDALVGAGRRRAEGEGGEAEGAEGVSLHRGSLVAGQTSGDSWRRLHTPAGAIGAAMQRRTTSSCTQGKSRSQRNASRHHDPSGASAPAGTARRVRRWSDVGAVEVDHHDVGEVVCLVAEGAGEGRPEGAEAGGALAVAEPPRAEDVGLEELALVVVGVDDEGDAEVAGPRAVEHLVGAGAVGRPFERRAPGGAAVGERGVEGPGDPTPPARCGA